MSWRAAWLAVGLLVMDGAWATGLREGGRVIVEVTSPRLAVSPE